MFPPSRVDGDFYLQKPQVEWVPDPPILGTSEKICTFPSFLKKASRTGPLLKSNMAEEGGSPAAGATSSAAEPHGSLRAALGNAYAFPQLRALPGLESAHRQQKASRAGPLLKSNMAEEGGFEPPYGEYP